jgi:hypothetical protein
MDKITISQKSINLAHEVAKNPSKFNENFNEFCKILKQDYPYFTVSKAKEKFTNLIDRERFYKYKKESLNEQKQKLKEIYYRYLGYENFNQYNELETLKHFYFNVDKKHYDWLVDRCKDLGYNEQYAPNDIKDIKSWLNKTSEEVTLQQNGSIAGAIMAIVFVCLFMWYLFTFVN